MTRTAMLLFVWLATACSTTSKTLSARESLTPVLLGPVNAIGPAGDALVVGNDAFAYTAVFSASANEIVVSMERGFDLALAVRGDGERIYRVGPLDCLVHHSFAIIVSAGKYQCRARVLRYYPSQVPRAYRFEMPPSVVEAPPTPPPPEDPPKQTTPAKRPKKRAHAH